MTQIATKLSFEDYLTYADGTDTRYELVDGVLVPMNPPRATHAKLARFLYAVLSQVIATADLPWIVSWDYGVRTHVRHARLPDLTVLTQDQEDSLIASDAEAVLEEAPMIAIEIVSPSTSSDDYRHKRSEYAVTGIPEYWIVDRQLHRVTVLTLVDGLYEESVFLAGQSIQSLVLPQLSLPVDDLFAR